MSNLKPTNKYNNCPVCGDESGKCRHNIDTDDYLCMTFADIKRSEVENGYKCVSHTKDGMWAIFTLVDDSVPYQKTETIQKVVTVNNSKLSPSERHTLYSQLLDELELHPDDYKDLIARGFTQDEIALNGFKSIQSRTKNIYRELPGIVNGNGFVIKVSGYICPIRNYEGQIIGAQFRNRDKKAESRYAWFSCSALSAHLEFGEKHEMPLPVFKPVNKPVGIAIVEGTGAKPLYVTQRLDYLTIGAAGGNWLSSENQLQDYLNKAKNEFGYLPITVFPDAGFLVNNSVFKKILELLDWLLKNYPGQIFVADWNQLIKEQQSDIDELPKGFNIRLLTPEAFYKKYKQPITSLKGNKQFQRWSESRIKLTADITRQENWVSINEADLNDCDVLAIRASLGSGKTQATIKLQKHRDTTTFLVGYRNSLIRQTIERANQAGLSALHIKDTSDRLEGVSVDFGRDESIKLFGGCIDSYEKLAAVMESKEEYDIVIDEIKSVLKHIMGAGTLKKRQSAAFKWLEQAIENCRRLIVMDANLTDTDLDLIRKLFPNKKIKVLHSQKTEQKARTFKFLETTTDVNEYSANAKYLPANLVAHAKSHSKGVWLSDSQKSCETVDEILTALGLKTFRLDGKTSGDKISEAFLKNPDSFLVEEKIDWLILSPSAESGLSINLKDHFEIVCLDVRGVLDVDGLLQLSARVRDTEIPLFVSCPEFVNFEGLQNPYTVQGFETAYKARLTSFASQGESFYGDSKDYLNLLQSAVDDLKASFLDDHLFQASLKDNQKDVFENSSLKMCFKTALCQSGQIVIDWLENSDTVVHEEVKETKEMVMKREAEKILNSPDMDLETAEQLATKISEQNYETKCAIRKAFLTKRDLPGIEETESWNVDLVYNLLLKKGNWLYSYWKLKQIQNPELASSLFKLKYQGKFNFSAKEIWMNQDTKIKAFQDLNILDYLTAEKISMLENSNEISAFDLVNNYYKDSKHFELIGVKPIAKTKQYVNTMFKKFASYFGLEVKQVDKNNSEKRYACQVPKDFQPFIADIDKCLATKTTKLIDEANKKEVEEVNNIEKLEEITSKFKNSQKIQKIALYVHQNGELPKNCEDLTETEYLAIFQIQQELENKELLLEKHKNLVILDSYEDVEIVDF